MADNHKTYDSKFLDDPEFQSLLVSCLESLQHGDQIDVDTLVKNYPNYETNRLITVNWTVCSANRSLAKENRIFAIGNGIFSPTTLPHPNGDPYLSLA